MHARWIRTHVNSVPVSTGNEKQIQFIVIFDISI